MAQDAVSRRFSLLRKQAQQAETEQTQKQTDALKRRFASIGQLGSGASIRAETVARGESAKRLGSQLATLGAAESAERQRLQEVKEGREFSRGEREASQSFGAEQAGLQRQFARGERVGGQEFAGSQAALQRRFQTGERLGGQQFASEQAGQQRQFLRGERMGGQQFQAGQSAAQRAFLQREGEAGRGIQRQALSEQRRASQAQEDLARQGLGLESEKLSTQRDQFDRQLAETIRSTIAQEQMQNANLNWQKHVFNKEFPLNVRIAEANIKAQNEMIEIAKKDPLKTLTGQDFLDQVLEGQPTPRGLEPRNVIGSGGGIISNPGKFTLPNLPGTGGGGGGIPLPPTPGSVVRRLGISI